MSYSELVTEDRRLAILQCLQSEPDYAMNEHILGRLLEGLGHGVSADTVRTDLAWLTEQGLIKVDLVGSTQVAKLGGRGLDAARGVARVPGVARPRPE